MKNVSIQLCIPGKALRSVSISRDSRVSDLKNFTPSKSFQFIYSGNLLLESMPLNFYGIQNEDCVVALMNEPGQTISLQKKMLWENITKHQDEFNEKLKKVSNPSAALEMSRLQDLRFHVQSAQDRNFYSKYSRLNSFRTTENPIHLPSSPTYYSKPTKPQTDPLPIFWKKE